MSENKVKLSKKTIIIIAIVAVVVALVATALIIFEVGRINQGKLINRIIVNTYPEREYYVGESVQGFRVFCGLLFAYHKKIYRSGFS